jgi:Na+-transporting methylmalonyl-CoA/oxaloacetate decarboxylase gamma subunit
MLIALQISLIGMSLVFGAIVLLWAVMTGLVRATEEKPVAEARAAPASPGGADQAPALSENAQVLKHRAALVAVAVALAQQRAAARVVPHAFPLPSTAQVSTWQSVMRSQQLKQRGPVRR